jgi:hypothetical protein
MTDALDLPIESRATEAPPCQCRDISNHARVGFAIRKRSPYA